MLWYATLLHVYTVEAAGTCNSSFSTALSQLPCQGKPGRRNIPIYPRNRIHGMAADYLQYCHRYNVLTQIADAEHIHLRKPPGFAISIYSSPGLKYIKNFLLQCTVSHRVVCHIRAPTDQIFMPMYHLIPNGSRRQPSSAYLRLCLENSERAEGGSDGRDS